MAELEIEEFLEEAAGGGRGGYLDWREEGSAVVWLHPSAKIHTRWSHRFWRMITGGENEGKTKGVRINCLESDKVNDKQRFRTADGEREHPAVVCPHCLCIEWVREQIDNGDIDWTTPLFHIAIDDADIILHAGGFTGQFGKKNISEKEKKQLRKADIRLDQAFKENGSSQKDYILTVIPNAKPEEGAIIATEKQSLGKALMKTIKSVMDEYAEAGKDKNEGNPKNNPYAFKFNYYEKKSFSDKYDVEARRSIKISEPVQKAFDADPPDLTLMVAPPDESALRALRIALEEFCLIDDMPFDSFFEPAEKAFGYTINGEKPEEGEEAEDSTDEEDDNPLPESWGGTGEEEGTAESLVECDKCKEGMPEDAMVCPHCDAEYEEDADGNIALKPEKPKPRPRRRKAS